MHACSSLLRVFARVPSGPLRPRAFGRASTSLLGLIAVTAACGDDGGTYNLREECERQGNDPEACELLDYGLEADIRRLCETQLDKAEECDLVPNEKVGMEFLAECKKDTMELAEERAKSCNESSAETSNHYDSCRLAVEYQTCSEVLAGETPEDCYFTCER